MADLTTTLGTAALAAIADGDVHWAAELVIALDHLLEHNGIYVVLLAAIYSLHKIGMAVGMGIVERWRQPRRRESDSPPVKIL